MEYHPIFLTNGLNENSHSHIYTPTTTKLRITHTQRQRLHKQNQMRWTTANRDESRKKTIAFTYKFEEQKWLSLIRCSFWINISWRTEEKSYDENVSPNSHRMKKKTINATEFGSRKHTQIRSHSFHFMLFQCVPFIFILLILISYSPTICWLYIVQALWLIAFSIFSAMCAAYIFFGGAVDNTPKLPKIGLWSFALFQLAVAAHH